MISDFDTIIVGAGICGLSIAIEIADEIADGNLLIVEGKKNIYQTSSANALGILGGHGCLSAKEPQSQFRYLLKKSLNLYPSWLAKHFGENALNLKFIDDHLYLNQKNKNTYRLRKLIENEKSNVVLQKPQDFFDDHPKILELLKQVNDQQEILKSPEKSSEKSSEDRGFSKKQIATFSDTMVISVQSLISMMEKKLKEKNIPVKYESRIEKIKFQNEKVILAVKKIEEDGKSNVEMIQCRRLIIAAGEQTAHLLSLMGYRLKSFFSWAEQLHDIPLPQNNMAKISGAKIGGAKINNLSRWSEGKISYLFSPSEAVVNEATVNEVAASEAGVKLSLTGFEQKNKWHLAPSKDEFEKWLSENCPSIFPPTSQKFKNIEMHKRYGVRTRTKNWLPLVGFLDEKVFIATSVYKSGITLAPLISHIASLLLKKSRVSQEDQKMIEILSPLSQPHQNKILRPYTNKDLTWLHYPFFY